MVTGENQNSKNKKLRAGVYCQLAVLLACIVLALVSFFMRRFYPIVFSAITEICCLVFFFVSRIKKKSKKIRTVQIVFISLAALFFLTGIHSLAMPPIKKNGPQIQATAKPSPLPFAESSPHPTKRPAETQPKEPVVQSETPEYIIPGVPRQHDDLYVEINNNIPYFKIDKNNINCYIKYSEVDELLRCGPAEACLGGELLPNEPRPLNIEVTPSGWCNEWYDSIEKGYLYNRCHLIAYALGGNSEYENIITGTGYFNVSGMYQFESRVIDFVKYTGDHVAYRVTPVFEGDNLVASGVIVEAYSIEDDGLRICFNVFVYNEQPGIEIDYKTGESTEMK